MSRRDLFRSRSVVALLGAEVISTTGAQMTWIALPWFVLVTTGSATKMSFVVAAELIGVAALGFPGAGFSAGSERGGRCCCATARAPAHARHPHPALDDRVSFAVLLIVAFPWDAGGAVLRVAEGDRPRAPGRGREAHLVIVFAQLHLLTASQVWITFTMLNDSPSTLKHSHPDQRLGCDGGVDVGAKVAVARTLEQVGLLCRSHRVEHVGAQARGVVGEQQAAAIARGNDEVDQRRRVRPRSRRDRRVRTLDRSRSRPRSSSGVERTARAIPSLSPKCR